MQATVAFSRPLSNCPGIHVVNATAHQFVNGSMRAVSTDSIMQKAAHGAFLTGRDSMINVAFQAEAPQSEPELLWLTVTSVDLEKGVMQATLETAPKSLDFKADSVEVRLCEVVDLISDETTVN